MACNSPSIDNLTASYLLQHPLLTWIDTNVTLMQNVPGAIWVNSTNANNSFLIGRAYRNGYYEVSKVIVEGGVKGMWLITSAGHEHLLNGFQVLTCRDTSITTTTIAPVFDKSSCVISQNLTGSSGNYLKSACVVIPTKTHSEADTYCKSIGMKFFMIESAEEMNATYKWAATIVGNQGGFGLNIDGFLNGSQWSEKLYTGKF
jgi:hypothetical protein